MVARTGRGDLRENQHSREALRSLGAGSVAVGKEKQRKYKGPAVGMPDERRLQGSRQG